MVITVAASSDQLRDSNAPDLISEKGKGATFCGDVSLSHNYFQAHQRRQSKLAKAETSKYLSPEIYSCVVSRIIYASVTYTSFKSKYKQGWQNFFQEAAQT